MARPRIKIHTAVPVPHLSRKRGSKGTIWADQNTAPIHKFRKQKTKKKPIDLKDDFKITETEDIALRYTILKIL